MTTEPRRILVVKLGALGNVILSLGPFASIRRHHAGAHITLLTTAPFAGWLARSPWFDDVWIEQRLDWWDLPGWLRLRRRLIDGGFDRVYDLQTSGHSSRYFYLLPRRRRPEWSGIRTAIGCMIWTDNSDSFGRPEFWNASRSICPGAMPIQAVSNYRNALACSRRGARRTVCSSAGRSKTIGLLPRCWQGVA
jgi:hypothetical protein